MFCFLIKVRHILTSDLVFDVSVMYLGIAGMFCDVERSINRNRIHILFLWIYNSRAP